VIAEFLQDGFVEEVLDVFGLSHPTSYISHLGGGINRRKFTHVVKSSGLSRPFVRFLLIPRLTGVNS